jgi:hypothetical protein
MVDKAIVIEKKIKEMEKDGKRKVSFPGQFFKPPQMNQTQMPMQIQRPQFQMQRMQYQMQKPSAPLQRTSQQLNHQDVQVQPRQKPQPVPRPTAQPSHNAQNQGGQGLEPCFKCSMSGHLARKCPTSCLLVEQEASYDLKGSKTTPTARLTT